MRLKLVASVVTVLVIVVGFAMISPLFYRPTRAESKQEVMLSFSVLGSGDDSAWCQSVSSVLNAYNIGGTVFVVGKVAEQYPQTVTCFSNKVDVGSETYDGVNLTSISDYSLKLQEVQEGKAAVDAAGGINSSVFQAPFGATDQDIYSLLSRSGILADFSYSSQYNVYRNGQFVKCSAAVFDGANYSAGFFLSKAKTSQPWIIEFDDGCSVSSIQSFVSGLSSGGFEFVNASQLAGLTLTGRS